MPQNNWRWCNKCEELAFAGAPALGACPAGGDHDHNGSGNYSLAVNEPNPDAQDDWRWCNKCQALTFAGAASLGTCPAGGDHNHDGSGNYGLLEGAPVAGAQGNWQWCNKCQALAFTADNLQGGPCAAGGQHDHSGSGEYMLSVDSGSAIQTWSIPPLSAGKIDCNGATLIARQDGGWQFYGSLHDNSTFYGDNYAIGFVFRDVGGGSVASGSLGSSLHGPVDGTFNLASNDPWITLNWDAVRHASVHTTLTVSGDLGALVGEVWDAFKTVAPVIHYLL